MHLLVDVPKVQWENWEQHPVGQGSTPLGSDPSAPILPISLGAMVSSMSDIYFPSRCLHVNLVLAKSGKLGAVEAAACTLTRRMGWGQRQLPTHWLTRAGGKGGSELHSATNLWGDVGWLLR